MRHKYRTKKEQKINKNKLKTLFIHNDSECKRLNHTMQSKINHAFSQVPVHTKL